ncbi:MAG TPA: mycothiol system anti-sigma-R factor [Actinomycetaceae bacterium]|nr:mycothiol system anti-sigma-R factor [Actinomycetaceae bacterium]
MTEPRARTDDAGLSDRPARSDASARSPQDAEGSGECDELLAQLYEFIDSEISDEACSRFRGHLADCATCREAVAAENRLREVLRRSCFEVAPTELRMRVVTQIGILRSGRPR